MILLVVDVAALLVKAYWGTKTLLASTYKPRLERRFFNRYFITSMCYYINTLGKYALIFTAFRTGSQPVDCFFATSNLATGLIGCLVFAPCIYFALLDADRRHSILVKGAMQSTDRQQSAFFDEREYLMDKFLEQNN